VPSAQCELYHGLQCEQEVTHISHPSNACRWVYGTWQHKTNNNAVQKSNL